MPLIAKNNNSNLLELQKEVSLQRQPNSNTLITLSQPNNNTEILIPRINIPEINNFINNKETGSLIDFICSIKNKKDYIIESLEYIYNKFNDKPLIIDKLKSIIKIFLKTTNNKNINSITKSIKSTLNNASLSEYEILLQQFIEIYEEKTNNKERIIDILKYIYDKIKNNKKYISRLYYSINLYEGNGNLKSIEENFDKQKNLIEIYIDSRIQNNSLDEYKPLINIFKSVYNQRINNSKENYFEILLYIYNHIKDNKQSVELLYSLIIILFGNSIKSTKSYQQKLDYISIFIQTKLNEIKEYKNYNSFSIKYSQLIQIFKAVYRIQYDTNNSKNYTNLKKRLINSITSQNSSLHINEIYRRIGTLSQPINKEGFLDFTLIEYYIYDSKIHGTLTDKNKLLEVSPFYYSNGLFHINPNQNSLWKKIRKYLIDIIDPNNKNSRNNSYYNNHQIMINNINLDDIMNNISSINNNNKKSSIEFEEKFIYNITFGSQKFIKNFYEMCKKYSFLFNTICLFKNRVLNTYTIELNSNDQPILSKLNSTNSDQLLRKSLSIGASHKNLLSEGSLSDNSISNELSNRLSTSSFFSGGGLKSVQTGGLAIIDDALIGAAGLFVLCLMAAYATCLSKFSLNQTKSIAKYKTFYRCVAKKTIIYFLVSVFFIFGIIAMVLLCREGCIYYGTGIGTGSYRVANNNTSSNTSKNSNIIKSIYLNNNNNYLILIFINTHTNTVNQVIFMNNSLPAINLQYGLQKNLLNLSNNNADFLITGAQNFISNIFNIILLKYKGKELYDPIVLLCQELSIETDKLINNISINYQSKKDDIKLQVNKSKNYREIMERKFLSSKEFIAFKICMMKIKDKKADISYLMEKYEEASSMNKSIAIAL